MCHHRNAVWPGAVSSLLVEKGNVHGRTSYWHFIWQTVHASENLCYKSKLIPIWGSETQSHCWGVGVGWETMQVPKELKAAEIEIPPSLITPTFLSQTVHKGSRFSIWGTGLLCKVISSSHSPFSPCKDPSLLLSLRFSAWWKFIPLDGQVMQPLFTTRASFLWGHFSLAIQVQEVCKSQWVGFQASATAWL